MNLFIKIGMISEIYINCDIQNMFIWFMYFSFDVSIIFREFTINDFGFVCFLLCLLDFR